ncbi:hypothetical protein M0657_001851 [Pyricularia oryzae]|uniref:Uncharacterized protein n=3 Tax=Pyricularia oryzae TaxID=318829 RepID=A0A4P7NQK8_PYROR|nr:hypothetical protein OOU_Y34scaffold00540g37 [Pyricularia oryzae Y34]KAI7929214.1 hypothetical protein M9X92_001408 [Pyricularia oryzae]KAI7930046.1 hypothetical protein M0657_001851 [Pyricularia oryzae]QBZ64492.1 hypothetical protein PoMZ_06190 [Pyricularia oryzae]
MHSLLISTASPGSPATSRLNFGYHLAFGACKSGHKFQLFYTKNNVLHICYIITSNLKDPWVVGHF